MKKSVIIWISFIILFIIIISVFILKSELNNISQPEDTTILPQNPFLKKYVDTGYNTINSSEVVSPIHIGFDANPLGDRVLKLNKTEVNVTLYEDVIFVYDLFTFQVRSINYNNINLLMSCGDSCGFSAGGEEGKIGDWTQKYNFYYKIEKIDFPNRTVVMSFYPEP